MSTRSIEVIDSHTEGNPTRVVIGGVQQPPGNSVLEQQRWLAKNDDGLRKLLNWEPRGNPMMCAVLLGPAHDSNLDFSAIIMEQDVYVPMCGHCVIGAATTVLYAGIKPIEGDETTVQFDTPAGPARCTVDTSGGEIGAVTIANVPSFLLEEGRAIQVPGVGRVTIALAFGGDFYAIVDADALGVQIDRTQEGPVGELSRQIIRAVEASGGARHPDREGIDRCYEVLFTTAHPSPRTFRHTVASPPGKYDRSPCGTGTSARLAALIAKGEAQCDEAYEFEGPLGTRFKAIATEGPSVAGVPTILPKITGRAYVTARSTILVHPDDPFPDGYRIGPDSEHQAVTS
ncbi:proline racemase family protein [Candidatus Poriferisodalis sp.]|uniref:proline racemase family protein n=1 Tax=Candidatus Poriferisodalis sp. TaxID=3101277 RepID=UPI003B5C3B3E